MADDGKKRPIIIKREEVVHGGHHGGAWKVAYADFMTAMMAFFLLMWLLNATTDEQKRGIAEFFNPMADRGSSSGSDQALLETSPLSTPSSVRTVKNSNTEPASRPDGKEMHQSQKAEGQQHGGKEDKGILTSSGESILSPTSAPILEHADHPAEAGQHEIIPLGGPKSGAAENVGQVGQGNSAEKSSGAEMAFGFGGSFPDNGSDEDHKLQETLGGLRGALTNDPNLHGLQKNLGFQVGADEIRIEVQDTEKRPMFNSGATAPNEDGANLLRQIGMWLSGLPEDISITGATDANPYHLQTNGGLSNWTLSEMRADKARELLVREGYPDRKIRSVEGRADRNLANPNNPEAPENRRIIITIHRLHPLPAIVGGVNAERSEGRITTSAPQE